MYVEGCTTAQLHAVKMVIVMDSLRERVQQDQHITVVNGSPDEN